MEDLLPFYERELAFVRRYAREFAERYPSIAGRLMLSGDGSQDPHIERMIEAFALLNARISKKIEDDYPEFTESFFEVLYPHYLRPFPSCSIARFQAGAAAQMAGPVTIPRGTELISQRVGGVSCRFRTAYDVVLGALRVSAAKFRSVVDVPDDVALPAAPVTEIVITIDLPSERTSFKQQAEKPLRMFIEGEPSFSAALRDALFMRVAKSYIEVPGVRSWIRLNHVPLSAVGFAGNEALIDYPSQSHPSYRMLTEFLTFPVKFNFFDVRLDEIAKAVGPAVRSVKLHLLMSGIRPDSDAAELLETLSVENLQMGCTPVVNLFRRNGEPIRVSHTASSYPVLADSRRASAYEVYSIDSVKRVRQTPHGEHITEFRPFYSLRHGESPESDGYYWVARRDALMASRSPGYELSLSLVDINFDPTFPQTDIVSLELTCTNRDLAVNLAYGAPEGDLVLEGGSPARVIHLLRRPTPQMRFECDRGAQWRLISHLGLSRLSLAQSGLSTFKEVLRLYDLPHQATTAQVIDGIVGLDHAPAVAWLPGPQFPCMIRGLEIRLTVDENSFVGVGIHAFASVLDVFFGLYVHVNNFTQLVLLSSRTGEEIWRCPPRSGESALL